MLLNAEAIAHDMAAGGHRTELGLLADPVFPFMSGHRHDDEVILAPVLHQVAGNWHVRYRRQLIGQGRERRSLGDHHVDALAAFEQTITKPELLEEFTLRPGDFWVLDNRRWLHGRRAFAVEADRLLKRCKMYELSASA